MKNKNFIGNTFDNCFSNVAKTLKLKKHQNFDGQSLSSITKCLIDNESATKVKEKCDNQENSFSFSLFPTEDVLKQ